MGVGHVLIICYEYSPLASPHAFRWSAIADQWLQEGMKVDVLTAGKQGLPGQERIAGVDVYRVAGSFGGLLERLRAGMATRMQAERAPDGESGSRKEGSSRRVPTKRVKSRYLASAVKALHDRTWKKIYWPDFAWLWIRPAFKLAVRLLREKGYDSIITVSHPFSCHVVGMKLKQRHPDLNWLVDVGDPFCLLEQTPVNNFRLYGSWNRIYERRLFCCADAVAVTPEAQNAYAELFPECAEKMRVVMPMLSMKTIPVISAEGRSFFTKDGKKRLVFVGTLYRSIRNPQFLLRLFGQMRNARGGGALELHFFGNSDDCSAFFGTKVEMNESSVFVHGPIPHDLAIQVMQEADVLVNIGNSTPFQLPSKVVEYAATGRPVLNIAKSSRDSSASFFSQYPNGITVIEEEASLSDTVVNELVYKLLMLEEMDRAEVKRWLEPYTLQSVAKAYKKILLEPLDQAKKRELPGETLITTAKAQYDSVPHELSSSACGKSTRKIVLVLTQVYLPGMKAGGPIRSIANLVERLGDQYDFRIITSDRDLSDTVPYPSVQTGRWNEVGKAKVCYLPAGRLGLIGLRRMLRLMKYDVLYINSCFSLLSIQTLLLHKFGLVSRSSCIIAPRGELSLGALGIKTHKKRLFLMAAKLLGLYPNRIWQASTAYEEADIRRVFGRRIATHISSDLIACIHKTEVGLSRGSMKRSGSLNLIFLSRIAQMKNLKGAVSMLEGLSGNVRLDIYGPIEDPIYWDECLQQISLLPSNVQVTYCGPVDNNLVVSTISQYDALLLPTFGENFGHVLLEAMSAGCPVVTSDRTPWRDLAQQGVGWDLPLERPDQFSLVLQRLVEMDESDHCRLSISAREFAAKQMEAPEILLQNEELFNKALSASRQREVQLHV